MFYDLIKFHDGTEAWREVAESGEVVRYADNDGNTVDKSNTGPFEITVSGGSGLPWMVPNA